MDSGARRKNTLSGRKTSQRKTGGSRRSRGSGAGKRKSRVSTRTRASARPKKMTIPQTRSARSRQSVERIRMSRADSNMSLTDLQFLAKSRGIPFGGLSRAKLAKKINNYMY